MVVDIDAARKLNEIALSKGYKRGQHKEEDGKRGQKTVKDATKHEQDRVLDRYLNWTVIGQLENDPTLNHSPDVITLRHRYLSPGVACPDLAEIKDFARFYAITSRPILGENPTVSSMKTQMQYFFMGFERVTGTETDPEDREEIYRRFIPITLVAEGLVVNKKRQKQLLGRREIDRMQSTVWTKDDIKPIMEVNRVMFNFILRIYCWTGARLSAFFTGGFRWKDIQLVLKRVDSEGNWEMMYTVRQRWVKNNYDPENIFFDYAGSQHKLFMYNDCAFLAVLALSQKALRGYDNVDDLFEQKIPPGEDYLVLRFEDDALERPVIWKVTVHGSFRDEPMSKSTFVSIFKDTLKNAGYTCDALIHAIRRSLGKKVDSGCSRSFPKYLKAETLDSDRYTAVERSQHVGHSDPRIWGQSYVANCSSVDGQAAFLEETTDHHAVNFFQSLEKYHDKYLPVKLPDVVKEHIREDREFLDIDAEVRRLGDSGDIPAVKRARARRARYRQKWEKKALRQYQENFVQDRRDAIINSRGKVQSSSQRTTNGMVQILEKLFPEKERIAAAMCSKIPLSAAETRSVMKDLLSICTRDFHPVYLPGAQPHHGVCPSKDCHTHLARMPAAQRNDHNMSCVRKEIAKKLEILVRDVRYCYLCYSWITTGHEEHLRSHFHSLSPICHVVTYCKTVIRPGFCLFCLEEITSVSWKRDEKLWSHVDQHLRNSDYPQPCPHPTCSQEVSYHDADALIYHFADYRHYRVPKKKLRFLVIATSKKEEEREREEREIEEGEEEGIEGRREGGRRQVDPKTAVTAPAESRELTWITYDPLKAHLDKTDEPTDHRRGSGLNQTICPALLLKIDQGNSLPSTDHEDAIDRHNDHLDLEHTSAQDCALQKSGESEDYLGLPEDPTWETSAALTSDAADRIEEDFMRFVRSSPLVSDEEEEDETTESHHMLFEASHQPTSELQPPFLDDPKKTLEPERPPEQPNRPVRIYLKLGPPPLEPRPPIRIKLRNSASKSKDRMNSQPRSRISTLGKRKRANDPSERIQKGKRRSRAVHR